MATDRELLEQRIKNAPKRVQHAAFLATLLGLLLALRGILSGISAGTFSGKSMIFGVIIFAFFLTNGISLLTGSGWAYVLIALFALLPVLGSFAGAVHLLALVSRGALGANLLETTVSFLAVFQFIVIVVLFVCLLAPSSRAYVWKSSA